MLRHKLIGSLVAASLLMFVGLGAGLSGCPPTSEPTGATPSPCSADLPPPSQPCLPHCGNEFQVGMPCTEDGGQCTASPTLDYNTDAVFCTADYDPTDLWFCTKPCDEDSDCGPDAVCTGDPEGSALDRGCFPLSCWEDEEPTPSPTPTATP